MSAALVSAIPRRAGLSEASRILNVLVAPAKTFKDLRGDARWWVPWLLILIVSLGNVLVVDRKIGFEHLSRSMIEQSSHAAQFEKLSTEQKARQIALTTTMTRISCYVGPIISLLLVFAIIAGVLMVTFNFGAGAELPFKSSLAIVCYGSLPTIIYALVGIITILAGVSPEGFDVRNPIASNPAYFMDPNGNQFLYGMASALDVFVIWSIALMAIGYSANSKLNRSTTFVVILGWYLTYKLLGCGLGALLSY